jgi:hypothetical protein
MANCKYCNKPSGFFKKFHKECEENFHSVIKELKIMIGKYSGDAYNDEHYNQIYEYCNKNNISIIELQKICFEEILSWINDINDGSSDLPVMYIDPNSNNSYLKLIDKFNISNLFLNTPQYELLNKSLIIDLLCKDKYLTFSNSPLQLENDENLINIIYNIKYYKTVSKRVFQSNRIGISQKVLKGTYINMGNSRGESKTQYNVEYIDTGDLYITTKNLYLKSKKDLQKFEYKKIQSFQIFSDCIELFLDKKESKPYYISSKQFDLEFINTIFKILNDKSIGSEINFSNYEWLINED